MKILVIEDEKELSNAIVDSLIRENYVVEVASDYFVASKKIGVYEYDCILLDIMLPGGSGLQLLKEIKKFEKSSNVIIISAKDSIDDKVRGLELGADDYLVKPFHIAELNARIKALLRRKLMSGRNVIELANIVFDIDDRTLKVNNENVALNRKEFDMLSYFLLNKNRLVSKTALAEHVWGDNIDQTDSFDFIYYQIKNLRKKLLLANANIEIDALYGMGYKLVEK